MAEGELFGGTEVPNLGANIAALVIYCLILISHIVVGTWYRQWFFMISWSIGLVAEVIGYAARVYGHYTPSSLDAYSCQMAVLTFAPAFFMAGIYYQLGIFVRMYGRKYSLLGPRMTSYAFIVIDVLSIIIQAGGGGSAAAAVNKVDGDVKTGKNIMVAGLVVQVAGTTGFLTVLGWFYFNAFKNKLFEKQLALRGPETQTETAGIEPNWEDKQVQQPGGELIADKQPILVVGWLIPSAIVASTLLIYARSIYRVVELAQGWNGYLMYHEIYFLILETLLVVLATLVLAIFHPAFAFGKGNPVKRMVAPGQY